MNDEIRRSMALFSIGIVMKLTGLTARQIRYYEQHELIAPERTSGNQRLFSFNDVERLLEIKRLIEKGVNIAGIKHMLQPVQENNETRSREAKTISESMADRGKRKRMDLSDSELHTLLKHELFTGRQRPGYHTSLIQGDLHRYFK